MFCVKGHIINILGFSGHLVAPQLFTFAIVTNAAIDNV